MSITCPNCDFEIPFWLSRSRSVSIEEGLQMVNFTEKPNEEKSEAEILKELEYFALYDQLYIEGREGVAAKVATLNAVLAAREKEI